VKTKGQLMEELDEPQQMIDDEYRKNYEKVLKIIEERYQCKTGPKIRYKRTNHKHMEVALLQSEEKFRKVFQYSPDIITISTLKEGRYVEVNNTFTEIFGYERHEVVGRTAEALGIWVNSGDRDLMIKQIQKNGNIRNFEVNFRTKFDEIRTFCISGEPMDIHGEEHLIINTRDITESKRMEKALLLSEECFSKAFNGSPISMTITTVAEGIFINTNEAFNKMYGSTKEKMVGQRTLEVFWLDTADRTLVVQQILENGSVHDMEINFRKKSGEKCLALLSAELLSIMGTPCILGIFEDITELRKMEVEIARLDRLNLVGEMAASIGHEIRNPMTTVRGYLQLLRENEGYKQEIEYFDLMIEELDRANSIITEFLSLAKNKMVELKIENLNSIINKLLPLIQTKAIGRDQNIKLELNDVPNLLLDKEEIHQLILNLVNNGLESMPLAGNVTINTFVENGKVVLAVKDEGYGIDPKIMDKLGIPFLTTKEQGTGLGLAVCYRIAARHNAVIDIETNSTGTTFYIRFSIPIGANMIHMEPNPSR